MMTTELTIPTPDVLAAIDHAPDLAETTRTKYRRAVARLLDAGGDPYDATQLAAYAEGVSQSGRAFLKAAVRLYTNRLAVNVKALATPDNVDAVQANLYRIEALQEAVKVKTAKGQKTHTWLSQAQVRRLFATCADDAVGQRDRLALGLLVAAGLRREEAVNLTFDDVKLQPVKGKMRTVLAVRGKGAKDRTVPISDALANALDEWGKVIGHQGRVLRSIDRRREWRESLSAVAVFNIVQAHGAEIGLLELAPHDLRRTFAQLGYEAGVPITQICRLLGHSSVATTQRYLNLDLDLETTISDFIPF